MNKEVKEIQSNLFAAEFKNFCRKEFKNHIAELESMRKRYLFFSFLVIPLFILLVCFEIFGGNISKNPEADLTGMIIFDTIAFLAALWCILSVAKLYKNDAKKVILAKLLSFIGDFKSTQGSDETYTRSLGIFNPFDKYYIDDRIKGSYGLLKVDISEIRLSGNNSFSGILIKIPCLKKFEGRTLIKRCGDNNFREEFKRVHFDNIDFENFYDVYSTDEAEAKMLVNSRFIHRITQYAKYGIGENISFSFEHGNINIVIKSKEDWFEIPFLKPAGNIENYRNIIMQIITIMKIVDSLKVEKNIGL